MLRNHDTILRALNYQRTPLDPILLRQGPYHGLLGSAPPPLIRDNQRCRQVPLQLMVSRHFFNTFAPIVPGIERACDKEVMLLCTKADSFRFATRLCFIFENEASVRGASTEPVEHGTAFVKDIISKVDYCQSIVLGCNCDADELTKHFSDHLPHLRMLEVKLIGRRNYPYTQVGPRVTRSAMISVIKHPNTEVQLSGLLSIIHDTALCERMPVADAVDFVEQHLLPLFDAAVDMATLNDYISVIESFIRKAKVFREELSYQGVFSTAASTPINETLKKLRLLLVRRSLDTLVRFPLLRDTAATLLNSAMTSGPHGELVLDLLCGIDIGNQYNGDDDDPFAVSTLRNNSDDNQQPKETHLQMLARILVEYHTKPGANTMGVKICQPRHYGRYCYSRYLHYSYLQRREQEDRVASIAKLSAEQKRTTHDQLLAIFCAIAESKRHVSVLFNSRVVHTFLDSCLRNAEYSHQYSDTPSPLGYGSNTRTARDFGLAVNRASTLEGLLWWLAAHYTTRTMKSGLCEQAANLIRMWHRERIAHALRLRRLAVPEHEIRSLVFGQQRPPDSIFVAVRFLTALLPHPSNSWMSIRTSDFTWQGFPFDEQEERATPERLEAIRFLFGCDDNAGELDLTAALRDFVVGDGAVLNNEHVTGNGGKISASDVSNIYYTRDILSRLELAAVVERRFARLQDVDDEQTARALERQRILDDCRARGVDPPKRLQPKQPANRRSSGCYYDYDPAAVTDELWDTPEVKALERHLWSRMYMSSLVDDYLIVRAMRVVLKLTWQAARLIQEEVEAAAEAKAVAAATVEEQSAAEKSNGNRRRERHEDRETNDEKSLFAC